MPLSSHCAPALHLHPGCAAGPLRHVEYFFDHVRIERMLFVGFPEVRSGRLEPDRQRMLLLAYYGAFSREQLSLKLDMPADLLKDALRKAKGFRPIHLLLFQKYVGEQESSALESNEADHHLAD